MQAKTSEETRRQEVERSREKELLDLRAQLSRLEKDLSDSRQSAIESQNRLKADLETPLRENVWYSSVTHQVKRKLALMTRDYANNIIDDNPTSKMYAAYLCSVRSLRAHRAQARSAHNSNFWCRIGVFNNRVWRVD